MIYFPSYRPERLNTPARLAAVDVLLAKSMSHLRCVAGRVHEAAAATFGAWRGGSVEQEAFALARADRADRAAGDDAIARNLRVAILPHTPADPQMVEDVVGEIDELSVEPYDRSSIIE